MDLLLRIKGASPEEISRGIAAAEAVLERAGITARQAATGMFAIEGWDDAGFPDDDEPSEVARKAATLWMEASEAALDACCVGWPEDRRPLTAELELLIDPETQLADRDTALARLRTLTEAADGKGNFLDSDVGTLAERVAADLDDVFLARDLVSAVTVAFTTLALAHFHPEEPIEPKRETVLGAIDMLERATAKPISH